MNRRELINCPRCGKSHVIASFEFCFECRKEWEPLKEQTLKELKADFIADWDEDKSKEVRK